MLARQAERDDLLHQRAELVEIQRQIDRKGPVVDLLKQVRVSEGAWMTILADISRVIPHDVALANFHTQAGKDGVQLRLSGRALNEKKVAAFMNAINEQTLWAKTASLGPVSNERTGGDEGPQVKRFEIIVPVRGMLGGDL